MSATLRALIPRATLSGVPTRGPQTVALPAIIVEASVLSPALAAAARSLSLPLIVVEADVYSPALAVAAAQLQLPAIVVESLVVPPSVVRAANALSLPIVTVEAVVSVPTINVASVSVALPAVLVEAVVNAPVVASAANAVTLPLCTVEVVVYAPTVVEGTPLRADTLAYQTRVEADGGEVIDLAWADAWYQGVEDMGASLTTDIKRAVSPSAGVKKDGSGYISKLYDLSDNDDDLTQATGAAQAQYQASQVNSLAAAYFDGGDYYQDATPTIAQPNVGIMVARLANLSAAYNLFDSASISGRNYLQFRATPLWRLAAPTNLEGGTPDTNWHQFNALFNGASSELKIDGSSVLSGDVGTQSLVGFTLGANYALAAKLVGYVAASVILGTTTHRAAMETLMNSLYATY